MYRNFINKLIGSWNEVAPVCGMSVDPVTRLIVAYYNKS